MTELVPFRRDEAGELAQLLSGEQWPFHSGPPTTPAAVLEQVAAGHYDGETTRTWWVVRDGERVGVVRAWDVGDGTPLFDLRLRAAARGRGAGGEVVRLVTRALFEDQPDLARIEATTRQDNAAMRRALRRGGYVKEAHYRQDWPGQDGTPHDAVGYAILRRDWSTGSTTPVDWHDEPTP